MEQRVRLKSGNDFSNGVLEITALGKNLLSQLREHIRLVFTAALPLESQVEVRLSFGRRTQPR
jgi:hypothetical protein